MLGGFFSSSDLGFGRATVQRALALDLRGLFCSLIGAHIRPPATRNSFAYSTEKGHIASIIAEARPFEFVADRMGLPVQAADGVAITQDGLDWHTVGISRMQPDLTEKVVAWLAPRGDNNKTQEQLFVGNSQIKAIHWREDQAALKEAAKVKGKEVALARQVLRDALVVNNQAAVIVDGAVVAAQAVVEDNKAAKKAQKASKKAKTASSTDLATLSAAGAVDDQSQDDDNGSDDAEDEAVTVVPATAAAAVAPAAPRKRSAPLPRESKDEMTVRLAKERKAAKARAASMAQHAIAVQEAADVDE